MLHDHDIDLISNVHRVFFGFLYGFSVILSSYIVMTLVA